MTMKFLLLNRHPFSCNPITTTITKIPFNTLTFGEVLIPKSKRSIWTDFRRTQLLDFSKKIDTHKKKKVMEKTKEHRKVDSDARATTKEMCWTVHDGNMFCGCCQHQ